FQAEDGIRDRNVTGVQTCALPIFGGARITAVHRADDSGTTENFAEYLKATAEKSWDAEVDGNFPSDYGGEAAQGTDGVIQTVSRSEERRVGKEERHRGGREG